MKKKYLFIGIGVIFLILIAWFYRQQRFACGEGGCHKKEFAAEVCPQDCGTNTLSIPDIKLSRQPPECQVNKIVKLGEGSFPKWSPDGKLIAFNKLVDNKVYEIFTANPDYSGIKCLTCGKTELPPDSHRGQPYWHPNGNYLVFTAQNTNHKLIREGFVEQADAGRNHNIWIMTKNGERFWQMTDYKENWGVIKPTFSNDGVKIFWNEEFSMEKYPDGKWTDIIPHPGNYWNQLNYIFRKGEEMGAWRVVYGNLYFENGEPKINNIQKVNPPENFTLLEASGFTPNNQGFIYSYDNLKTTGGIDLWGDLYTTDLDGNSLTQLTFSAYNHDENPEYSPDGKKIAWSSSTGLPGKGVDLFIMDNDGKNKSRLTYFSDKSNSEYLGNDFACREIGWSPDGRYLELVSKL